MFTQEPLGKFLDDLASKAPAPGGGSVAALSGALGAALVSMVCNLTIGKEKYAAVEGDIQAILAKSEALRARSMELLEADVAAYSAFSAASKMPRDTDEQKKTRTAAMQKALVNATAVPMGVAEACVAILDLCPEAAEKGNVNAVSDVGVAALMAEAGLRAAALNVLINLGLVKDEKFVRQTRRQLNALLKGKPRLKEQIYKDVEAKL
jgi:glutamate formiminotransferase/formiminotetrahydrofolate cyclodeaminase